jgi:2-hydroxychromene-2-carboxylate isomerase
MVRKNVNRFPKRSCSNKKITPLGFGRAQLRAGFESPEVKEGLRDTVADAVARGIFGSPFIVVEGEPFRGIDRLHMVEHAGIRMVKVPRSRCVTALKG